MLLKHDRKVLKTENAQSELRPNTETKRGEVDGKNHESSEIETEGVNPKATFIEPE